MNWWAIGVDYHSAPVEIRGALSFAKQEWESCLLEAQRVASGEEERALPEIVLISTCNRTEFYLKGGNPSQLIEWWFLRSRLDLETFQRIIYIHEGVAVFRHVMQVSSGLQSMVLGESQILSQLKAAHFLAVKMGTMGKFLHRLFQSSFSISKKVRTHTEIARHSTSVVSLAVRSIIHFFYNPKKIRVLLLGTGIVSTSCAIQLQRLGVAQILIANHRDEKAASLAKHLGCDWIRWSDRHQMLLKTDVAIAATSSPVPILIDSGLEAYTNLGDLQLLIDLSLPSNIALSSQKLKGVVLYTLDSLRTSAQENIQKRLACVKDAQAIIEKGVQRLQDWSEHQRTLSTLKKYRAYLDQMKEAVLREALENLATGQEPTQVLTKLAHRLIRKTAHAPTLWIKNGIKKNRETFEKNSKNIYISGNQHA